MSEITSDSLNRDLIRQKDAEIQRLRNEILDHIYHEARLRKLITELCDALDGVWGPGGWDLKQRAREAIGYGT